MEAEPTTPSLWYTWSAAAFRNTAHDTGSVALFADGQPVALVSPTFPSGVTQRLARVRATTLLPNAPKTVATTTGVLTLADLLASPQDVPISMLKSRHPQPDAQESINDALKTQSLQSYECGGSGDCMFNCFAAQATGQPGLGRNMRAAVHFLTGSDRYLACLKTSPQQVRVPFFVLFLLV